MFEDFLDSFKNDYNFLSPKEQLKAKILHQKDPDHFRLQYEDYVRIHSNESPQYFVEQQELNRDRLLNQYDAEKLSKYLT